MFLNAYGLILLSLATTHYHSFDKFSLLFVSHAYIHVTGFRKACYLCTKINTEKYIIYYPKCNISRRRKAASLQFAMNLQLIISYKATNSTMHSQLTFLPFQTVVYQHFKNRQQILQSRQQHDQLASETLTKYLATSVT